MKAVWQLSHEDKVIHRDLARARTYLVRSLADIRRYKSGFVWRVIASEVEKQIKYLELIMEELGK